MTTAPGLKLDDGPGVLQEVSAGKYGEIADPGPGLHLWVMVAAWRIADPAVSVTGGPT